MPARNASTGSTPYILACDSDNGPYPGTGSKVKAAMLPKNNMANLILDAVLAHRVVDRRQTKSAICRIASAASASHTHVKAGDLSRPRAG
jgi:hypothetical protein